MVGRCHDCLNEFAADGRVFAVLKRMRDFPEDADPEEARLLDGLCWDEVHICGDCAGWYGDDPIDITDEARQ